METIFKTIAFREVSAFCAGTVSQGKDALIEEMPISMTYNGISHAVMLASPADLEDFAIGFSLSEGIVNKRSEIYGVEVAETPEKPHGIVISIEIASQCFADLKNDRRSLSGRTGCGLCGIESLEAFAHKKIPSDLLGAENQASAGYRLSIPAIIKALEDFPRWQPVRDKTGAAHCAAWVSLEGQIVVAREDVGRHNALDKLIGAMAKNNIRTDQGFVLISSRASYEMAQKSIRCGIRALVAISAPTEMAVRLAQESGLLLAGFARPSRLVAYSAAQCLTGGFQDI